MIVLYVILGTIIFVLIGSAMIVNLQDELRSVDVGMMLSSILILLIIIAWAIHFFVFKD